MKGGCAGWGAAVGGGTGVVVTAGATGVIGGVGGVETVSAAGAAGPAGCAAEDKEQPQLAQNAPSSGHTMLHCGHIFIPIHPFLTVELYLSLSYNRQKAREKGDFSGEIRPWAVFFG